MPSQNLFFLSLESDRDKYTILGKNDDNGLCF